LCRTTSWNSVGTKGLGYTAEVDVSDLSRLRSACISIDAPSPHQWALTSHAPVLIHATTPATGDLTCGPTSNARSAVGSHTHGRHVRIVVPLTSVVCRVNVCHSVYKVNATSYYCGQGHACKTMAPTSDATRPSSGYRLLILSWMRTLVKLGFRNWLIDDAVSRFIDTFRGCVECNFADVESEMHLEAGTSGQPDWPPECRVVLSSDEGCLPPQASNARKRMWKWMLTKLDSWQRGTTDLCVPIFNPICSNTKCRDRVQFILVQLSRLLELCRLPIHDASFSDYSAVYRRMEQHDCSYK